MERKVTKTQFIETIENNEEGLYDYQLAEKLGITPLRFCQLKKKYKSEIRDFAREMAQKTAMEQVNNLKRNAKKGDTQASKLLLELAKVYFPFSRQQIEGTGEKPVLFRIINDSRSFDEESEGSEK